MSHDHSDVDPIIVPIKHGFAARGPGWAVHGRTEAEARTRYREASQRHADIQLRPLPTYEPAVPRTPAQIEKSRAIIERVLWMLEHGEMFMEDLPPLMCQRLRHLFSSRP